MKVVYYFLSTVSSLSIAVWVYLVKNGLSVSSIMSKLGFAVDLPLDSPWESVISYILYLGIAIGIGHATTKFFSKFDTRDIEEQHVKNLSSTGEEMLLTYFGLFFYALSVPNIMTLAFTYAVLCIGVFLTNRYAYNPLLLFLGWHYYTFISGNKKFLLLTKEKYKEDDCVSFESLKVINPFTFVELK